MEAKEYAEEFKRNFDIVYSVASKARAKGLDPEKFVEIKAAAGLPARVEGIIGVDGLADMIKKRSEDKSRQELAFEMVKEICTGEQFSHMVLEDKLTLGVRVGLAVLTDAVVVAPTEGIQGVELHKSTDGSDYVAIMFAGPIRGAGGSGAAMSVAFADYGRKLLGIGAYKAQQSEIERCIEEMQIYHSRIARLQYYPPESDMKLILENLSVCVDAMATEKLEVNIHRNIKRLDKNGKEQMITNKVRGGIGLVICEGIAQKAKKLSKDTKIGDLDWSWLNNIIKVEKNALVKEENKEMNNSVFLQELVAGRPVFAYPGKNGSFRLRYGRSRLTGIAAKGLSPATMIILDEFIACGTQLKVEKPGKGCVVGPVDTIEGPFVKLDDGQALRINSAQEARELKDRVTKIISVGDILITYGDFKRTNTPLLPTSYVEEYWIEQLKASGEGEIPSSVGFKDAFKFSIDRKIPMHPLYIYDYFDISTNELIELSNSISISEVENDGETIFDVKSIKFPKMNAEISLVGIVERLCIPHKEDDLYIKIEGEHAQSILASLGFVKGSKLSMEGRQDYDETKTTLENVNVVSPFKIMKRSTRIGGRMGRPEKAKERLMKPSPNVLFPVAEYGGKERSLYKTYTLEKKKFGNNGITVELGKYKCILGKEITCFPYCSKHNSYARLERVCSMCGRPSEKTYMS